MNYWIFQSDPNEFPIKEELKYFRFSYWQINTKSPNNRKILGEIEKGDIAFIWRSNFGKGVKNQHDRGIYAIARILSVYPQHEEPYTPAAVNRYSEEKRLGWIGFFNPEEKSVGKDGPPSW